MAVRADCENCANDPDSPTAAQQNANIAVVLAVVGAVSLVALIVAVVVPLVRRRCRRRPASSSSSISSARARSSSSSYRKARTSDMDDDREMYLPSRRPSFLHQKMFPGPDRKPLLPLILDPLRPISAITWSDLRSSNKSPAASSESDPDEFPLHPDYYSYLHRDMADAPDHASHSTTRPRSSHRTTSRSTRGTGGAVEDQALSSLPSLQRSPTPPGLPSKRGSPVVAARRASLPITPISPSDSRPSPSHQGPAAMPLFAPIPSASTSAAATAYNPLSPVSPLAPRETSRTPSHARSAVHKPRGMDPVPEDADAGEYAETSSLQLPSPPASPDQAPYDPRWRASSSGSNPNARRPSLTGRQSAPTALPHRPRSSTGPSVALPLTAAFQTSVLRSGSSSSAAGTTSIQRYPSITASTSPPPRHRSRPSSVSVSVSSHTSPSPTRPAGAASGGGGGDDMARPIEAFRRMSTTDIRHRHPHSGAGDSDARAFLRSSDALHIPQFQDAAAPRVSRRHATVYSPPSSYPHAGPGPLAPPPLSPGPTPISSAPRLSVYTNQSQGQGQPTGRVNGLPWAVSWKSVASGSRASLSSQQSHLSRDSMSRSRSNSVRTLPAQLPPLDPVTPLSLSLEGSPEDEQQGGGAQ